MTFHANPSHNLTRSHSLLWIEVPVASAGGKSAAVCSSVAVARANGYTKEGEGVEALWEIWLTSGGDGGGGGVRLCFGREADSSSALVADVEEGWQVRRLR